MVEVRGFEPPFGDSSNLFGYLSFIYAHPVDRLPPSNTYNHHNIFTNHFFTSHKSFIKFMIFIATSKNVVRDTSVEFVSTPENTKRRIRSKLICGFV